jgi:hypothetical protein
MYLLHLVEDDHRVAAAVLQVLYDPRPDLLVDLIQAA